VIISKETYLILLYVWMAIAVIILPFLLKITVPYGRHTTNTWGPLLNNRLSWVLMEVPVVIVFSWLFFSGDAEKTLPVYIFYSLFMLHYFHRIFIFPFIIKGKNKKTPLVIILFATVFNLLNGFFNGYWFGYLNDFHYGISWLTDWRFILGVVLFFAGMYINITSDQTLINLRKGGKTGYYIPYGGMFKYVSSPSLFGEIIEWLGWAMMSWCLPSFSFALWTIANLIPRARDHHRWYHRKFKDYPKERKAVIPFLI